MALKATPREILIELRRRMLVAEVNALTDVGVQAELEREGQRRGYTAPVSVKSQASAIDELLGVVSELGAEELGVMLVLGRRLLAGQRAYGLLDLKNDARDWRAERAEELMDAFVYTAIAEVAATLGKGAR